MKPLYRKIIQASGSSFSFAEECPPLFETPWHFHPEFELILIEGSTGKRFMGDNIAEFDTQELVLIGPNLPHFWRNESETNLEQARAYVTHFSADFLGDTYFQLPELASINELLALAQTGLRFTGQTNEQVRALIKRMASRQGFEQLMLLQTILHQLAASAEYEPLSSLGFVESFKVTRNARISKIYEYVMYNFRQKITLETVASLASMSEVGFCRYFKITTGRSFITFLNEIRIGYACRLLIESSLNITQICYESGFANLAHFNRQFKSITHETPQRYRDVFKKQTRSEPLS